MKYIIMIFVASMIIGAQCKKSIGYCRIELRNNSSRTIGTCLGYNYPDISIPADSTIAGALAGGHTFLDSRGRCEDVFESLPKDTLSLFVFDIDTIAKFSWQEIRNGYKILKRYDLSLQDLKNNNYKITYP